jgi:hypothetical protein
MAASSDWAVSSGRPGPLPTPLRGAAGLGAAALVDPAPAGVEPAALGPTPVVSLGPPEDRA